MGRRIWPRSCMALPFERACTSNHLRGQLGRGKQRGFLGWQASLGLTRHSSFAICRHSPFVMCSNLFIIPSHLYGIPVFGFGLLLGLLLLAAAGWAAWTLRRPHGKNEVVAALPVLAIMAGAIAFVPRVFPDGFPIRGYGVMLIVAAVSGLCWPTSARVRPASIPIGSSRWRCGCLCWALPAGGCSTSSSIGTKFTHRCRSTMRSSRRSKYANGGLVVYGALFGAALAFVLFTLRHHLPMLAMADLVAPSLVVGLAFGRIGCLLNGCCYGGVADVPWAVSFPKQGQAHFSPPYGDQVAHGEFYGMRLVERDGRLMVFRLLPDSAAAAAGIEVGDTVTHLAGQELTGPEAAAALFEQAMVGGYPLEVGIEGRSDVTLPGQTLPPRSLRVHPTQLYSAVNAALLGWFLWSYYPARRRDGEVFALMITIYPIARFLLEMIRVDETSFLGTRLSISQNVSLLLLAAVGALWVYLSRRPRTRAFDPPGAVPQTV